MPEWDMKQRTKLYAINIIRFTRELPENTESRIIGNQLLRCATSVGANFRAACRARSPKEFIAKLGIVEEEADEVLYWLEILEELKSTSTESLTDLKNEGHEILSIVIASIKTTKSKINRYNH